jgi:nucleoside-diphosphate-sugar epimerase
LRDKRCLRASESESRWNATLKWEPKVPLRDGLARTIEYFDALLRNRGRVRNYSASELRA